MIVLGEIRNSWRTCNGICKGWWENGRFDTLIVRLYFFFFFFFAERIYVVGSSKRRVRRIYTSLGLISMLEQSCVPPCSFPRLVISSTCKAISQDSLPGTERSWPRGKKTLLSLGRFRESFYLLDFAWVSDAQQGPSVSGYLVYAATWPWRMRFLRYARYMQ